MDEENTRYYIPVKLFKWEACRAGAFPIKGEGRSVGFLEAFESVEEAQKENPNTEIFVIEEMKNKGVNDESE